MRLTGRVAVFCFLGACGTWAGCGGSSPSSNLGPGDGGPGDGSSSDGTLDDASDANQTETAAPDQSAPETGSDATVSEAGDGAPGDTAAPDAPSTDAPVGDASDAGSDAPDDVAADSPSDAASDASADVVGDVVDDSTSDSAVDAGEVGPPSLCADSLFVFCDGFEESLLTNWSQVTLVGGEASLDTTHVYRGAHSLHVTTDAIVDAGINPSAQVHKYGPGLYPTHIFTRFFVYAPSPPPAVTENLADFIENGGAYTGLELRGSASALSEVTFSTGADQQWQSADASLPFDQWVCFEVEIDTVAETQHVYMNDTEVTDLAQANLALGTVGDVAVGLGFFQPGPQPAYEAWVDEVAVDTARIGCSK